VYNPYLDSLLHRTVSHHYDMTKYRDDRDLPADDDKSDAITRHCDRRLSQQLASETDYERHVARRRCRLMTATEDAFAVIQRMNSSHKGV